MIGIQGTAYDCAECGRRHVVEPVQDENANFVQLHRDGWRKSGNMVWCPACNKPWNPYPNEWAMNPPTLPDSGAATGQATGVATDADVPTADIPTAPDVAQANATPDEELREFQGYAVCVATYVTPRTNLGADNSIQNWGLAARTDEWEFMEHSDDHGDASGHTLYEGERPVRSVHGDLYFAPRRDVSTDMTPQTPTAPTVPTAPTAATAPAIPAVPAASQGTLAPYIWVCRKCGASNDAHALHAQLEIGDGFTVNDDVTAQCAQCLAAHTLSIEMVPRVLRVVQAPDPKNLDYYEGSVSLEDVDGVKVKFNMAPWLRQVSAQVLADLAQSYCASTYGGSTLDVCFEWLQEHGSEDERYRLAKLLRVKDLLHELGSSATEVVMYDGWQLEDWIEAARPDAWKLLQLSRGEVEEVEEDDDGGV